MRPYCKLYFILKLIKVFNYSYNFFFSHGTTTNYGGSLRSMEECTCFTSLQTISGGQILYYITSEFIISLISHTYILIKYKNIF